jgi:hypothetical protein
VGRPLCACTYSKCMCVPASPSPTFEQFDFYGNSFEHQGIGFNLEAVLSNFPYWVAKTCMLGEHVARRSDTNDKTFRITRWCMVTNLKCMYLFWRSWYRASWYISIVKPTRCTIFGFIEKHSTCFGRSFRPSSGVQDSTHSIRYMSYRFVDCFLVDTRWNSIPSRAR